MFRPADYGPAVAKLLGDGDRLAELGPGTPVAEMRAALAAFNPLVDLGPVRDANAARLCHAGLWLYFDFLEECHVICQDQETPDGNFWHAIMHRREPDAFNSKYWWRKVGPQPVLDALVREAPALGYAYTSPQDFVDFCERHWDARSPGNEVAKTVQQLEWQLLFDYCYRRALG